MKFTWIIGLLIVIGSPPQATGQAVAYRWLDNDGVTHFSDAPPVATTSSKDSVSTMNIPQGFTAANPDDYYSIANQWGRAQQERADKDRLALEREQLRIEWYRATQAAKQAEEQTRTTAIQPPPLIFVQNPYAVPSSGRYGPGRFQQPGPVQYDYTRKPSFEHWQKPKAFRQALGPVKPEQQPGFVKPVKQLHGLGPVRFADAP